MAPADPRQVEATLRSAITRAMKRRDREATAVFRAALSAIDNAGAVAVDSEDRAGAIESAVVGAGRSGVPRRDVTEQEMIEIVMGEADERCTAAELVDVTHPEYSRRLRREAALLSAVIHAPETLASYEAPQADPRSKQRQGCGL